ncbi:MAG: acetyl-CoA carboxylase biotin carboxyl carrier protein [Candidatus Eisenbacteria bacterium]
MRSDEVRELIRIVEESEIEEIEISSWGRKIRISKRAAPQVLAAAAPVAIPAAPAAAPLSADKRDGETSASAGEDVTDLVPIKSPMVGTFYAAPAPDSDRYVKVGDHISKGAVVCIVEAMKLMNEIRSESDGRLVKVLVENGQPVEYGQTMFLLTPA